MTHGVIPTSSYIFLGESKSLFLLDSSQMKSSCLYFSHDARDMLIALMHGSLIARKRELANKTLEILK